MSKRRKIATVVAGFLSLMLGMGMARADVRHAIASMVGMRSHRPAAAVTSDSSADVSGDQTDQGDQNQSGDQTDQGDQNQSGDQTDQGDQNQSGDQTDQGDQNQSGS